MKAKVIREPYRLANLNIGDIVEIIPGMETDAEGIWNVPAGKLVLCKKEDGTYSYSSLCDMEIVDESPSVDWDAFRREAVKDILVALCTILPINVKDDVRQAINIADELIKQLKKEKNGKDDLCMGDR